jgi:hypothetical protein
MQPKPVMFGLARGFSLLDSHHSRGPNATLLYLAIHYFYRPVEFLGGPPVFLGGRRR